MNNLEVETRRRTRVEVEISTPSDAFPGLYEEFVDAGIDAKRARTLSGSSSGISLVLTRKGVEVRGWYDHFGGIEGGSLTWAEFDELRKSLV